MYEHQTKFSGNLHALRGLAALSVVFYHATAMHGTDPGSLTIVKQFGAGVTLFFILSGFSLSLSNFDKISAPNWLNGYVLKRVARIAPVWYCFIAITLILHYFRYDKIYDWGEILYSLVPYFNIVEGKTIGFVWAGWTIGVEVMFYTLFPLLLVTFRDSLKAWTITLVIFLGLSLSLSDYAGAGASVESIHHSFPKHAFIFIAGCTFFFYVRKAVSSGRETLLAYLMLAVSLTAFVMWYKIVQRSFVVPGEWKIPIRALALGGLTVFLYINPNLGGKPRFNLHNAFTKFLGDKSYTIYLAHPMMVSILRPFYKKTLFPNIENATVAFLIFCAAIIACTFVLATIVSQFVEAPLYAKGRQYAARITSAGGDVSKSTSKTVEIDQ